MYSNSRRMDIYQTWILKSARVNLCISRLDCLFLTAQPPFLPRSLFNLKSKFTPLELIHARNHHLFDMKFPIWTINVNRKPTGNIRLDSWHRRGYEYEFLLIRVQIKHGRKLHFCKKRYKERQTLLRNGDVSGWRNGWSCWDLSIKGDWGFHCAQHRSCEQRSITNYLTLWFTRVLALRFITWIFIRGKTFRIKAPFSFQFGVGNINWV